MEQYIMPLDAAKGCLYYLETSIRDGEHHMKEFPEDEQSKYLLDAFKSFRDFMTITVNAGIKEISIPERHSKVIETIISVMVISEIKDELRTNHPELLTLLRELLR